MGAARTADFLVLADFAAVDFFAADIVPSSAQTSGVVIGSLKEAQEGEGRGRIKSHGSGAGDGGGTG